jgi:hypothetical protein
MAGKPLEGRKKIPRRGNETHKRAYFSEKSLGQMIAVANRAYTKVISCGSQNVQRKSISLLKREREFIAMRLILTYVTVPFFNPYNLFSHFFLLIFCFYFCFLYFFTPPDLVLLHHRNPSATGVLVDTLKSHSFPHLLHKFLK